MAGADAKMAPPLDLVVPGRRTVGLMERHEVRPRRPVTLHGHDDEIAGDGGRRREEAAGIHLPPELARRDGDGIHVTGVVTEERGVSVHRDARATHRVELDRRVPHGLARVEIDRGDMGVERTAAGCRPDDGLADVEALADGVALDPGGESPNPSV